MGPTGTRVGGPTDSAAVGSPTIPRPPRPNQPGGVVASGEQSGWVEPLPQKTEDGVPFPLIANRNTCPVTSSAVQKLRRSGSRLTANGKKVSSASIPM